MAPTFDLFATEKKIATALAEIAQHGLALHGRRSHYSAEGLAAEWHRLTGKYATTVDALSAEVDAVAAAVAQVETYERAQLLPAPPVAGLTAAQELTVARIVARPGFARELPDVGPTLRPYFSSPVATVLAEEIQARNHNVTDEFLTALLAQESPLMGATMDAAKHLPTAVGVLRSGVSHLRDALTLEKSVNGYPVDSPNRAGHHSYWVPLSVVYAPEGGLKITGEGNFNV